METNGMEIIEARDGQVATFDYPDIPSRVFCEEARARIDEVNAARVKFNIMARLEIGRQLNAVCCRLPTGRFDEWHRAYFPDWSKATINTWRTFAQRVDAAVRDYVDFAEIQQSLHNFKSTTAAMEWVGLPERVQLMVVQAGAWTWTAFKAVCWTAAMQERLEDVGLGFERRHGDVLHAIDDVLHDEESSELLREAAQAMWDEHEEAFARLSDRQPAEVRAEVGAERRQPTGDAPRAQLVEGENGYWLCRWDGEKFEPVAPVAAHVLMWPGPVVLAAFPKTDDGPAAAAWQGSAVDAVVRRLNASTYATVYGDVL